MHGIFRCCECPSGYADCNWGSCLPRTKIVKSASTPPQEGRRVLRWVQEHHSRIKKINSTKGINWGKAGWYSQCLPLLRMAGGEWVARCWQKKGKDHENSNNVRFALWMAPFLFGVDWDRTKRSKVIEWWGGARWNRVVVHTGVGVGETPEGGSVRRWQVAVLEVQ